MTQQKLWAWQFKDAKTTGVGARIAKLENGGGVPVLDNKMEIEETVAAKEDGRHEIV